MRYSEIFYSIQGEGKLTGVPSIFVRLSGCPLRCVWCDTPYTSWTPENKRITVDYALKACDEYPASHVVVTGGEPFAQSDALIDLCDGLAERGKHVTIETAGVIFAEPKCDLMSVSPKMSNSTPTGTTSEQRHERNRMRWDVLLRFRQRYDCQWKFVVRERADLPELQNIVDKLEIDPGDVILMPEGATRLQIDKHREVVAEMCKERGFRYSPRAHVDIWGKQRGV